MQELKCNRQFPCTSCERRGCASVCPNGIVEAGRGSRRHILATTSQLQETVRCLEARISELEDALEESHARYSTNPHPLLQDRASTQAQTSNAPSTFVPIHGQPSPPSATIASTSPPAYSPQDSVYHIDNPGSNTPHAHPFSDVSGSAIDELIKRSRWEDTLQHYDQISQATMGNTGDVSSSSSSVEFTTPVASLYTNHNISSVRSGLPQGQQQDRIPEVSDYYIDAITLDERVNCRYPATQPIRRTSTFTNVPALINLHMDIRLLSIIPDWQTHIGKQEHMRWLSRLLRNLSLVYGISSAGMYKRG
ncbi:hypothetical protein AG1IA_02500 [Rhizoctonia solani AG-1 IA]|uniref:4Fe-4S ferredoxin-type domain-containing protein n=1 Tax=Thanatephorus cucumeris (strain AG1-IA) TaxID=983506 RepID=L8X4B4_THACA|nr:hypothetical protein AG1IA_02500 [Rhizoctonia solani AG-1 IA]